MGTPEGASNRDISMVKKQSLLSYTEEVVRKQRNIYKAFKFVQLSRIYNLL